MSTLNTQVWHDREGNQLTITTDQCSGLAELIVRKEKVRSVRLEIIQQARSAVGLALGPAVAIFTLDLRLDPLDENSGSIARFWLEQHLVRHFRQYYYRITFP